MTVHRRGAENAEETQRGGEVASGSPLRFLCALRASAVNLELLSGI